ncbi:MAG: asparaginase [Geminicoccaceae bacterium]|nr:asparaginase [Geminicoccaceae bacterium]
MKLPVVRVFALGGTIATAARAGKRRDAAGLVPSLSADALVDAVPSLCNVARIEAVQFRQVPSPHLTTGDIVDLACAIAANPDATVVTQGTDTIEETAFALECLLARDAPVVVTGAMRNPTLPGADGPANLLAAVQVAVDAGSAGSGVLVAFNDEIHAARFVVKGNTALPSAFASPQCGRLAQVVEGRICWFQRVGRLPALDPVRLERSVHVPLWTVTLGDDGELLETLGERIDGLVVATMGGGHVPPHMVDILGKLAARIPVVLASRAGTGPLLRATYGYAGGEIDLASRGMTSAGWLAPNKARMLLQLALMAGESDIPRLFEPFC